MNLSTILTPGYSQGMTHVAGMLLLHMNEVEAFISLSNLMDMHLFVALFKLDLGEVFSDVQSQLNISDWKPLFNF